ncbi:MAG: hypothetical protein ABIO70_03225 [Pseudomonadota bacterium]
MHRFTILTASLLAVGCAGEGTWVLETWGEDYIEQAIPADVFADGCDLVYDTFLVVDSELALMDGDGEPAGTIDGALVFDMTQVGPHEIGSAVVPATHYDEAHWRIAPMAALAAGNATTAQVTRMEELGAAVYAEGALTCGGTTVGFAWAFDTDTTYHCEPEDLTIPAGGEDSTQLTVHGDHLFYDGLENEDAAVRGQAIVDADADGDGFVTQAELQAVSVANLGYDVGSHAEVEDLWAHLSFLSRTLGHVDGEGHCQVDL